MSTLKLNLSQTLPDQKTDYQGLVAQLMHEDDLLIWTGLRPEKEGGYYESFRVIESEADYRDVQSHPEEYWTCRWERLPASAVVPDYTLSPPVTTRDTFLWKLRTLSKNWPSYEELTEALAPGDRLYAERWGGDYFYMTHVASREDYDTIRSSECSVTWLRATQPDERPLPKRLASAVKAWFR